MLARQRTWFHLVMAAATALGGAGAGTAQEKERFRVFVAPFQITELAGRGGAERAPLNAALIEAAEKRSSFLEVVLTKDIVKEALNATEDVEKLLASLSGKADILLYPTVTREGFQWLVRFQLYDLQSSKLLDSRSITSSGSLDALIPQLWAKTDMPVFRWKALGKHEVDVTSLAWRGDFLASFDAFGVGKVFKVQTGKVAATFSSPGDTMLRAGPAGAVTFGYRDARIQFWNWDLTSGAWTKKNVLMKAVPLDVALGDAEGKVYVAAARTSIGFIVHPKSKGKKKEELTRLDMVEGWNLNMEARLVDAMGGSQEIWSFKDGLPTKPTPQVRLYASPGHKLLSILSDGKAYLVNPTTKKPVPVSDLIKPNLVAAAFGPALPSGRCYWACCTGAADAGVDLYRVPADQSSLPRFPDATLAASKGSRTRRMGFSPDGRFLAVFRVDNKKTWIEIWEVSNRPALLARVAERLGFVDSPMAFDPTGRFFATCWPEGNDVAVWEVYPNRP